MLNLLSNVAILDVTNTTPTVVFLDNVMEGVDGAAVFGLSREAQAVQIQDNQTYQYAHTDTLDIRVLDTDNANIAILKSIVENQRPVQIAAISPNGVLSWQYASLLSYTDQFDVLQVNPIQATVTYPAGYSGGTTANSSTPVYAGDNILAGHDITTGNSALLSGHRSTGGLTLSQSGGVQTATATSTGVSVRLESWYVPFPWQGVEVTASYDVSALAEDPATTGSVQIGVEYLDSTGYGAGVATGAIASNYVSISTLGSAPFRAVTKNVSPVDSSLRYIVLTTRLQSPTAGDGLSFEKPMITVSGSTAFTL